MIRDRKLKYCPRTKHCEGRWKLKKAIARCCYQKDGLCLHAPSLLRYLKANNIKVRLTDNYICVACVRPSIISINVEGEKCVVKDCGQDAVKIIVMAHKKTRQLNTFAFCKKHLKAYEKYRIDRDARPRNNSP